MTDINGPDLSGYYEAMDNAARQLASAAGIPAQLLIRRLDEWMLEQIMLDQATPAYGSDEFLAFAWPCADIRDIASVFADRPGYRPEWRP